MDWYSSWKPETESSKEKGMGGRPTTDFKKIATTYYAQDLPHTDGKIYTLEHEWLITL